MKKVNGEYHYNGIDRKNNSKGYTLENAVPCCGQCNIAKASFTEHEFISWVRMVYENTYPPNTVHQ